MKHSRAAIILSMRCFFSSGEGRGIALVRVAVGESVGCNASCFLYGTYSNSTCGSCSFPYNSPMCGDVAGPCQLCSGFRLNVLDFRKAWFLAAKGQTASGSVRLCDIVEESEEQAATGAPCLKAKGPWDSHKCYHSMPYMENISSIIHSWLYL